MNLFDGTPDPMARWTWHGGGLDAARAHFGEGEDPWLDLSTGINPHSWPDLPRITVDWRALPSSTALAALETAAAAFFGCSAAHVCAVPGSEVGLRLTGAVLAKQGIDAGFRVSPGYRTHERVLPDARAIDARDLPVADGGSLILANPDNPHGRLLSREDMVALCDRRGREGWLLVDEAFVDCHERHTMAGEVDEAGRLVVFRSFGKFFGLAGLRLGFVVGPRVVVDGVRAAMGAWPVGAGALAIGTAAYRDKSWIAAMRWRLPREAAMLDRQLAARGWHANGACPLFRMIACEDARALFERLARRAILTRPFAWTNDRLRIGLPAGEAERNRLLAALGTPGGRR